MTPPPTIPVAEAPAPVETWDDDRDDNSPRCERIAAVLSIIVFAIFALAVWFSAWMGR